MVEARSLDQHRFNFKPNTFYGLGESLLQSTSGGEQAQFYAMCIHFQYDKVAVSLAVSGAHTQTQPEK